MARRARTTPRKTACQQRSRATVDALVEATARVLIKEGYDRASTNKIAAVAGVSIGSLYQYFPSKEALVAAVIDRHGQVVSQAVRNAAIRVAGHPVESAVREFVSLGIEAHRVDPRLHRVLAEEVPRIGRLQNVEANVRDSFTLARAYLEAHRDELDTADLDMAAFIAVSTVEALTHAAVIHRPEMLAGDRAQSFVDEVTRLLVGYLRKPEHASNR
jgi:AcrR family transcriptional regulator